MFFSIILYSSYTLINYFIWYNKSKKSVDIGGSIIENFSKTRKYFDIGYLIFLFLLVGYMFIHLFTNTAFGIIALSLVQLPLFALVFWGSITLLKRRKFSANANKIISTSLLILAGVLYLGFIFYSIPRFSFSERSNKPYTTVGEYRLYSDKIPLTCEDLYGLIDFEYYSYEADEENTPLLHRNHYSQTRPPMKNAPPELEYSIYEPKFEFVKNIVVSDLTKLNDWSDRKLETLDNAVFSTEKAYAFYYESPNGILFSGEYILVFTDKIIHIVAETPFTDEQIEIIKSKLLSGNSKV
jgi:hypothetical protein